MIFRASILDMSFSGNVSSVGNTLRIEVTSNGAAVRSLVLANLAALGYGLTLQHITMHNRANYAVCKICYDSNDGSGRVKHHTDYEVAYGSRRSTSKLANHFMLNFCPSYFCSRGV